MVIKRTIDKETVKDLPKAAFPGQIHVVQTPWEAEKAVAYLKSCPLLGIDSETRPSFTKGQIHKVALLQISSEEHCFLFRLNLTGLTLPVITLLENPSVTKVGLSLRDDFMMLHKRAPFEQHACIELQEYVRAFGIQPAEDIRHPLRGKDFEKPAPFQLGSRNLDRTAETVCRHRCLGMPQHLQQAARTETDRRF